MTDRLPETKFSTLAASLRSLDARGGVDAFARYAKLSSEQHKYILGHLREARLALELMAAHEPVIRSLVGDKWGDE